MLNGRFGTSSNKFTSVSSKGLALVNYTLVPLPFFDKNQNFTIHDVIEIRS